MTLGTVSEWAKRWGISRQAAHKRIKDHGIPVHGTPGKLDMDAADAIWRASMNPLQAQRGAGKPTVAPPPDSAPRVAAASLSTLSAAQLRRELVRLEKETILLAEQKRTYAPVAEVNTYVSGMIARAKETLLRIAPELRDTLAIETDPVRCEQLVEAEVHRSLRTLAEYRPHV